MHSHQRPADPADRRAEHRNPGHARAPARRWKAALGAALVALALGCNLEENSSGGSGASGSASGGGGTQRRGPSGNGLPVALRFAVQNDDSRARVETILASVPFPQGLTASLADYGVRGHQVAWLPLQRWPDGSVRVAQVQLTDALAANEAKTYEVVQGVPSLSGGFAPNDWVASFGGGLRFGARVQDTFGVDYEAYCPRGGEVMQETYLVRVTRHRLYHQAVGQTGIGRDYLASTFYVTEYRDAPWIAIDWVLGNDYLGADDTSGKTDPNYFPLGDIDVNSAQFLARGAAEVQPYLPNLHAIEPPVPERGGWSSFRVMSGTYLADGQTRRYRFCLRVEDPNAAPGLQSTWAQRFAAFVAEPLQPLATLAAWQATGALGLHGGPLDGPSDAFARAERDYQAWLRSSAFGTFGDFGDVKYSNTTGTPRNAPVSPELAHAIQGSNSHLLRALEQKAWAQAMRPYHLFGLTVGAEQDILLWDPVAYVRNGRQLSAESLGRLALWSNDPYAGYRSRVDYRGHDWNGYDHEHWTTDLLFDYWTVSGDAWAREELRQLGESVKGLMRLKGYYTASVQPARAEGWCMVGLVQAYLATGDVGLRDYALRRVHEVCEPQRQQAHPSRTMYIQDNDPRTTFPQSHRFIMPWQHAAVIYGFLAAHEFFGDDTCLRIAEDAVATVEYSWVRDYLDPVFGLVPDGLRFHAPYEHNGSAVAVDVWDATPGIGVRWGDEPLGGAHDFFNAALLLLAERSEDPVVQQKALHYGNILLGPLDDAARWYKWNTVAPEQLVAAKP